MDKLRVNAVTCFGCHGILAAEREIPQRFVTTVEVELDLAPAGRADDPDLTVDYTALLALISEVVEGPSCGLIEALAERMAAGALERFPLVKRVTVEVLKPNPPVAMSFGGAAVVLTRSRANAGLK